VGRFIAIEGGDGSGKGTQSKLLAELAQKKGYDVLSISFPRYGEASAYYVEQYLNGNYGSNDALPADLTALPFAIDRFAAKSDIINHLKKPNSLVISDRYMASNLAHQGAKIDDIAARQQFYKRTLHLEYDILGIPKPDISIVLLVPSAIAQANVDKKTARNYTNLKRDILEADASHQDKAKRNFEELCQLMPDYFAPINCINDSGTMYSIDDIASAIADQIKI